jgi:hypothetical protein
MTKQSAFIMKLLLIWIAGTITAAYILDQLFGWQLVSGTIAGLISYLIFTTVLNGILKKRGNK